MASKFWTIVNWGVLVFLVLFAVSMVWDLSFSGDDEWSSNEFVEECVDVKKISGFEYDACFDAYSEMIFLKVKRFNDDYEISLLKVSFVDFATRFYELEDVPGAGEERAYKISAEKKPQNIDVKLDVVKDFSEPVCDVSESVFVDYCPAGTSGEGVGVSMSPIEGVEVEDFVEIKDILDLDSDIFTLDLVDVEKVWESACESRWECGEWEVCENEVQRRDCEDIENCIISKNSPITVRGCEGQCIENWECEWEPCEDGVSIPHCKDLNSCGTRYDIPEKLECGESGKCVPDVECGEWSDCEVDYDFFNLIGAGVVDMKGSKSRVCVDKNKCILPRKDTRVCSVSIDIYTNRFERCGEEYIGVYDILNDGLLVVVKEGTKNNPYLNIYFDERENVRCDYCFDGVMNGDEEGIDCGGSCKRCVDEVFIERGFWEWMSRFLW